MWRPLLHIPRVVNNGFGHKVEPRAALWLIPAGAVKTNEKRIEQKH